MVNTRKNSHVEYLDQVISCGIRRRPSSGRAPGPGPKPQAPSVKLDHSHWGLPRVVKASSSKLQAQSGKLQASSRKLQAPLSVNHGTCK